MKGRNCRIENGDRSQALRSTIQSELSIRNILYRRSGVGSSGKQGTQPGWKFIPS
jgi:hypothetical protein